MKFKQEFEARYIVKKLRERREKLGYTLEGLAEYLGCSKSLVAMIERGERTISESQKNMIEEILGS